jgi:hypothetical protein
MPARRDLKRKGQSSDAAAEDEEVKLFHATEKTLTQSRQGTKLQKSAMKKTVPMRPFHCGDRTMR